ncbi:McrB family protein [Rhodococcus erythropolis]|uniref:McrB family protein n=1 Tax=Rhodococcus erythropolis TaxID=1833 RepID=UPI0024B65D04|nr:AAA family ATPase [Rhodococcus erythropolis]MDJ0015606.1 AAA family ATPase [Rhodococcus erythropolis]
MAYRPVEAVFVVFYGKATHKAVYGRDVEDGGGYTKDYIQLIQDGAFKEVLEQMFPRTDAGSKATQIDYRWPGGSIDGSVEFESADRPHLAWLKTKGAPPAWKMTPTPTSDGPETIPGNPAATTSAEADQQLEALIASGVQPYLVAVKLKDETNIVHTRVYLDNPTPDLTFADVALLPVPVRQLVEAATPNRTFKWLTVDSHAAVMTPAITSMVERLEENPALLLMGPPGTGKTVLLEQLVDFIENPGRGILFDPDLHHDAWQETEEPPMGKTRSVVLHPSYTYSDLVLGLLPHPTGEGVGIRVSTGPLINLAHYASANGNRALLVLDEFNRGNAAAILGDTLALIDKDKRGRAFVDLPYGDLGIDVPSEFAVGGSTTVSARFTLPETLWIVAAMNTSDRSVAPLDAALRRRFSIYEMPPDYDALAQHLGSDDTVDLTSTLDTWTLEHVGQLSVVLLKALNVRIDAVLGPDFRLGQSHLWHVAGQTVEKALISLIAAFDYRVVPTLRLSLQDDDGALAAILRAGTASTPVPAATAARWQKADTELGTFGADRLHLHPLSDLPLHTAFIELRRQAGL